MLPSGGDLHVLPEIVVGLRLGDSEVFGVQSENHPTSYSDPCTEVSTKRL